MEIKDNKIVGNSDGGMMLSGEGRVKITGNHIATERPDKRCAELRTARSGALIAFEFFLMFAVFAFFFGPLDTSRFITPCILTALVVLVLSVVIKIRESI